MNDHEKQYFEDLLVKAIQSGKKETSGLVTHLKDVIVGAVRDEVKLTVNGKIDQIKKHLERQDIKLEKMDRKIDDLTEKTLPVVESITLFKILKKFVIWVAPLGLIVTWLKWIR